MFPLYIEQFGRPVALLDPFQVFLQGLGYGVKVVQGSFDWVGFGRRRVALSRVGHGIGTGGVGQGYLEVFQEVAAVGEGLVVAVIPRCILIAEVVPRSHFDGDEGFGGAVQSRRIDEHISHVDKGLSRIV